GRDRDRRLEERLLPAAARFPSKGHRTQQGPACGPQTTYVRAAIRGASLVKADPGYETVHVRTEFQTQFHSRCITIGRLRGSGGRGPDRVGSAWRGRWRGREGPGVISRQRRP